MSTKFSVRPAPRKRPWICKRSPPCLVPPPFPPSLIATFMLQYLRPGPPGNTYSGSFLLHWQPGPANYLGMWIAGLNQYAATFVYDPLTGETTTFGNWDLGGDRAWGWYMSKIIPLPPNLLYETYEYIPTIGFWRAALTITG